MIKENQWYKLRYSLKDHFVHSSQLTLEGGALSIGKHWRIRKYEDTRHSEPLIKFFDYVTEMPPVIVGNYTLHETQVPDWIDYRHADMEVVAQMNKDKAHDLWRHNDPPHGPLGCLGSMFFSLAVIISLVNWKTFELPDKVAMLVFGSIGISMLFCSIITYPSHLKKGKEIKEKYFRKRDEFFEKLKARAKSASNNRAISS